MIPHFMHFDIPHTDYGHPERAFFKNYKLLGLGRQIGLNFMRHLLYFWPNYKHYLVFWHCESLVVAGSLSHKKLWFLGIKHITPKCSQNKILAVKNLGNSVHTSLFGDSTNLVTQCNLVAVFTMTKIVTKSKEYCYYFELLKNVCNG